MADIARVRSTFSYGQGSPGLGTHYFSFAGASPSVAELADMVARVRAFYNALITVLYNGLSIQVQGNIETIDRATGILTGNFATAAPAVVTGTGGASSLPPAAALVIRLTTNQVVGRRLLQGRCFVGPLATSAAGAQGAAVTGAITGGNTAIGFLLAVTSTAAPVVWHRPIAAGSGSAFPIVGGSTWANFGSLRSRRD